MSDALTIRIKKTPDGGASLSCTRADRTVTWHRHKGAQAGFFPRHDLTHFAVETVLFHRRGFYTLVGAGWDLSDFGTPSPRGKVPAEAQLIHRKRGELFERWDALPAGETLVLPFPGAEQEVLPREARRTIRDGS